MQYVQGRMGAKYQWSPDPVLAAVVGVVTVIIVLIPAVCSVCFRLHLRRHQPDQVLRWVVNGTFYTRDRAFSLLKALSNLLP